MPAGFRIAHQPPSVSDALLDRFAAIPVACISDSMARMTAGGSKMRPIGASQIIGRAVTVKTRPGDNLMVHKALTMAKAGDVLVVDAGGELSNAIIGERMLAVAESIPLAGIIINGAIRDVAALRDSKLAVFAAGVTHRGPYKTGPGEINHPIAIDGMVIASGDIIVADEDGFLCIAQVDAEIVCEKAEAKHRSEQETSPLNDNREWIDATLRALGCEYPE